MKKILITLVVVFTAVIAEARFWTGSQVAPDAGEASQEPPGQAKNVKLEQKLGTQIPLDLTFADEEGKPIRLRQLFGDKPVILTPVYFDCPMLCNMVLDGMVTGIRDLRFQIGEEYEVVSFSFNPNDTPTDARQKKDIFVKRYGRPGAEEGWRFLTGKQPEITALTEAIGFRYGYDPQTGQYAHAAMAVVLTPDGRIARYFYGFEFRSRDLRLALVEAGDDKIGSPVDQFLLLCYHYDPATGKYSATAMNAVRAGGVATVAGIAGFIFVMVRRDKRLAKTSGKES
jgi:protein SCO1/2